MCYRKGFPQPPSDFDDDFFLDEPRDETRCNLEMPRWLRARIKANAKADGRTMIQYLSRVIPE